MEPMQSCASFQMPPPSHICSQVRPLRSLFSPSRPPPELNGLPLAVLASLLVDVWVCGSWQAEDFACSFFLFPRSSSSSCISDLQGEFWALPVLIQRVLGLNRLGLRAWGPAVFLRLHSCSWRSWDRLRKRMLHQVEPWPSLFWSRKMVKVGAEGLPHVSTAGCLNSWTTSSGPVGSLGLNGRAQSWTQASDPLSYLPTPE